MPIAKVGRPHGLRGAFFVSGRDDLVPLAYGDVFIGRSPGDARLAKIESSIWQSGRPVLKCSLAVDRTQAEALTHLTVFVDGSKLRKFAGPKGIFWRDLDGAQVVDSEGSLLGIVQQVYNTGASDIIEVVTQGSGDASTPRRSLDIPLIEDYADLGQALESKPRTVFRLKVPASFFEDLWQELT